MSRVAWSTLIAGSALTGGAVGFLVYARFGWYPTSPVALGAAFFVGAFAGTYFGTVALVASKRVDNTIAARCNRSGVAVVVQRAQRIDPDLLGLADEAGVRGGAR